MYTWARPKDVKAKPRARIIRDNRKTAPTVKLVLPTGSVCLKKKIQMI